MKRLFLKLLFVFAIGFFSSCSSKQLSDDDAKNTVMKVVQKDSRVSLIEWQGLIKNGDNEMKGRAKLRCNIGFTQEPTVEFLFHKNSDNVWVLDQMHAIDGAVTQGVANWTDQTVFEKVTK